MMENKKRRTLIIGGVAGGATAAARLRRRDNDRENTFPMQTVGCPIMLEALSKTETRCF